MIIRCYSKLKALVVYDSVFGNTEKLAKALASGLKSGGVEVDVVKVDSFKLEELNGVDLLCVGSPTHAWNASKSTKEFLEQLSTTPGLKGKKAFAFATKMKSRLAGDAGGKIENKLKDAGLTIVRRTCTAIVEGREGPLEETAEETFEKLGEELAQLQ